jgi:hypothetical protein
MLDFFFQSQGTQPQLPPGVTKVGLGWVEMQAQV